MAKHAYHFKHDFNAHSDEKIIDLRMAHGFEGYGLFWYIVELLANAQNYQLGTNYKRLAFTASVKEDLLRSVIEDFGLFEIKEGFFFSNSLKNRMQRLDEIKKKRSEAGFKGGKSKANAKQMLSNSQASAKQTEAEESKGEESKGEKRKPTREDVFHYCFFENQWFEYDPMDFYVKMEEAKWQYKGKEVSNWKNTIRNWRGQKFAKKMNATTYKDVLPWIQSIENEEKRLEIGKAVLVEVRKNV